MLLMLCLLSVSISHAITNLANNGSFEDGAGNPSGAGWSTNADAVYYLADGNSAFCRVGWWWWDQVWSSTWYKFLPNTTYVLRVQARAGDNNVARNTGNDIAMWLWDVTDLNFESTAFEFPITLTTYGTGSPWEHFQATFHTSVDIEPNSIGHYIGINLAAINGPDAACWTDFDAVALYSLTADDPVPAMDNDLWDNTDEVGTDAGTAVEVTLEWSTAVDMDLVTPDPNVVSHLVYLDDKGGSQPDWTGVTPVSVAATGATASLTLQLGYDRAYWWKVEEQLDDSTVVGGNTWAFETIREAPTITDEPDDVIVAVNGTAAFEVLATSATPISYQWYRSSDLIQDPLGDTPAGTNSASLTLVNVQPGSAGTYIYCVLTNSAGNSFTRMALLEVQRPMGRWKLDNNTFDSSVNTWHGTLVGLDGGSITAIYQTGIDGFGMVFNADRSIEITGSEAAFNNFHLGLTVSAWVKTSAASDFLIVASKEDRAEDLGWTLNLRYDGRGQFVVNGVGGVDGTTEVDDNQWHLLTATYDGSSLRLYIDGRLETETAVAGTIGLPENTPVLIGGNLSDEFPYSGTIDDVQVYNYARAYTQVVDYYNAYAATPIPAGDLCIADIYAASLDVSGPAGEPDCVVNLHDLAEMAAGWLSGGSYPL